MSQVPRNIRLFIDITSLLFIQCNKPQSQALLTSSLATMTVLPKIRVLFALLPLHSPGRHLENPRAIGRTNKGFNFRWLIILKLSEVSSNFRVKGKPTT